MNPIKQLEPVLQDEFFQRLADSANEIYRDMSQVPTVLRKREGERDSGAPIQHPLLAMRMARMGTLRERLASYASTLIEGEPSLDRQSERFKLAETSRSAIRSCFAVLECSDSPDTIAHVKSIATKMKGSLGLIANIVKTRQIDSLSGVLGEDLIATEALIKQTAEIAKDLNDAYEDMTVAITAFGPRGEPAEVNLNESSSQ